LAIDLLHCARATWRYFPELPHEWSDMKGKPFLKVKLPPHAAEYKTVSSKFFAGLRKSASCVVTKVSGPSVENQQTLHRRKISTRLSQH